ncbi:MAG: methionyl-tRNA formyltransferase [Candidatus Pacebacteria bacterium]|nr:methionyl-tRNA formyltransferase [Candidatus Paceibacterota bacterium]MCF7862824.1 methionyl-tRNA formyltransferase [Candidatus Paceibacterota bacterium]
MNKLNFVFWGSPEVSSKTLEILKEHQIMPSLVVTTPDRPKGRKLKLTPSPTKIWATENNIPFLAPEKIDKNFTDELLPYNFDLFIVVAFGKILPKSILDMPKFGSINIHYSLLPKYRGASPLESAILNGDTETGITIQQMESKMDSGPILAVEKIQIANDINTQNLREKLITLGGELLAKTLPEIYAQKISPIVQNENDATFCHKIQKDDGLIDLKDSAIKNYNKFRAYIEWPRTFFFENNKRIIITEATLENNIFKIKKVLPEGKKEIPYEIFLKNTQKD